MLEELEVRNLGPIRHALLDPSPAMTAITGETGAGKSMLLNAIRLISGQSADAGRVRTNTDASWAQGIFVIAQGGRAACIAHEAGVELDGDDDELFLTRTVPVSGRSRAVLSGRGVPRSVLARLADELVTIHGQSDQLSIASEARQRDFLDMVAGDDAERKAYATAWDSLQELDRRLTRLRSQEASARQRADYLRSSIDRINAVDPQPHEDEDLKERRSRIEHAAQISQGVETALQALDAAQIDTDAEGESATDMITRAVQALRSIRLDGVFADAADRLESLNADLADIVFTLSHEVEGDSKVEDLDALNDRIHALGELTRSWGPTLQDVIAWRGKAVFEAEDLDASPEKVAELAGDRDRALHQAMETAGALSKARSVAAKRLSEQVNHELSALAMRGSRLDILVRPRDADDEEDESVSVLDAHGRDEIAFMFTPYPGAARLPMGSSASGGELSRLMLALELSVASQRSENSGMTFIFDEVDAGVGGKAAVELGRRLARLARHSQVIVVTHLAQVASWADTQFVVSKARESGADGIATTVSEVRGEERVREIARMLSGSESAASLDHARELIASSVLEEQP